MRPQLLPRAAMSALTLAVCVHAAAAKGAYAPVNGLNIYYEIHGGDNAGTPLVLLHGGGSTIETSFATMLPPLAKNRKIIAFEQQGHGHTADVDRPFSFEQSADDTAALLDYLKIDKADFFGYSNGGTIVLQLAIRHPNLVRKIIPCSTTFARNGMAPEFWDGMKHASLNSMPQELKDAYVKVAPHPENLQSFHDKSVKRMLEFKNIPAEELKAITAPSLVMVGDADVVRPEHAVELYRLLPHAQLAVLPGIDHMTMVTHTDLQVAMIEAFLDAPMPTAK